MNTQLIESIAETILALSPAEQSALWNRLEHGPAYRSPSTSEPETALLQKINQRFPDPLQERYTELREKLRSETITSEEHQELCQLIDATEQFDADRLQHLISLAQLRQVPLPELLQQLKISPPAIHV
jgi:iron-sulfur cluster repair protein YtfE (RIC family)